MSPERREPYGAEMAASREISCGRCGALIKPGKKFCSQCGCPVVAVVVSAPVKSVRRPNICPECSFENHHSDLFCKGCGSPLTDSPSGPPSPGLTLRSDIAPPGPEAVAKADVTAPLVSSHERSDLGRDLAGPLLLTSAAPSLETGGEAPAAWGSADSQVAKPRRPGPRALGIAALGVGLGVLIGLVNFHRPARAQAKQLSIASTAFVTRAPSPTRPTSVAPTDSADQGRRSLDLTSAEKHGQSRRDRTRPLLAAHEKSLANASPENPTPDVPKLTATGAAPVPATAYAESEPAVPLPVRPVLIAVQSEVAREVPSVTEGPQTPKPLVEVSRQIPAALPSSTPANLPAEISSGPVSPGAAASTPGAERASGVQPAKLLSRPALRYPALALEARVQGDVHLEANVLADGTVSSVRIVSGLLMLNDAAAALVKNSRYQPALVDGRAVRSYVDVVISFRLPR